MTDGWRTMSLFKHVKQEPETLSKEKISFAGREFFFEEHQGNDLVASAIKAGVFEAPLPILVMATLSRLNGIFVDVGANSGIYTIWPVKQRKQ